MSFATLAAPFESVIPFARPALTSFGIAAVALRPLIGLGLLAAALWLFKPLLRGAARAVYILFHPRRPLAERAALRSLNSVRMLQRMARELDSQQPNVAAELRLLAARG